MRRSQNTSVRRTDPDRRARMRTKRPSESCARLPRENDLGLRRDRRIEQTDNNPRLRVSFGCADEKVRVFFPNHLRFKALAKRRLPLVSVLSLPTAVSFPNLPIHAHHAVAVIALSVVTGKFVAEPVRDFLKLLRSEERRVGKE